MNDPHVVALFYNIDHGNTVSYNEAEPLDVEEKAFRLEVKDRNASFYLKDHYAGEAEARISIEEYIRNWEFDACLHGGYDCFNLIYERAEIVDRNPLPSPLGAVEIKLSPLIFPPASVSVSVSKVVSRYPSPPRDVAINADVQTMFDRYMGYRRRLEPITGMAYFCFTFLNYLGKKRLNNGTTGVDAAARYFQISRKVLTTVSNLCSTKGGPLGARKHLGVGQDLTNEERLFLKEAAKKIIRRAAEREKSPTKNLTQVTMSDLPPL